MSGSKSRNKGANFEREVARKIYDELGISVCRNLTQYQSAGNDDLRGMPGWSIECKRIAKGADSLINGWWAQTIEQAAKAQARPVLIYKEDRKQIQCAILLGDVCSDFESQPNVIVMNFETWCLIARETVSD